MLEMLNNTANWEISSCKRGSCRPRANWRNNQANLQNTGLCYEESDATGLEWNEWYHQNVSRYIHLDVSRIGLLVNDVLPNVSWLTVTLIILTRSFPVCRLRTSSSGTIWTSPNDKSETSRNILYNIKEVLFTVWRQCSNTNEESSP